MASICICIVLSIANCSLETLPAALIGMLFGGERWQSDDAQVASYSFLPLTASSVAAAVIGTTARTKHAKNNENRDVAFIDRSAFAVQANKEYTTGNRLPQLRCGSSVSHEYGSCRQREQIAKPCARAIGFNSPRRRQGAPRDGGAGVPASRRCSPGDHVCRCRPFGIDGAER